MLQEADFAFRQAYVLCPSSPEALFRYVNLLVDAKRVDDALLLAQTSLKFTPENAATKSLVQTLQQLQAK